MMRKFLTALTLALAITGASVACSSNPRAETMCTALDQGSTPAVAIGQNYQVQSEAESPDAVRQAVKDIRDTCPAHSDVADTLESVVDMATAPRNTVNGVNPNPMLGG